MLTQGVAAEWGVYVRFLDNGDEIAINADAMMDTMSLIKVPLLVSLMRRVDRGEVDLGRRITLAEDQKRLGTGILRYFEAGASFSLRDAAWLMEAVSDNSATDICLEAAGGVDVVNGTMRQLGIEGIRMTGTALDWFRALGGSMAPELATLPPGEFARRGYPSLGAEGIAAARARYHFETGRPFSLGTPRAFGELLSRIEAKTCASAASCDFILEILSAQQLRDFMPRYVWGAAFAHKTGNFAPYISSDIGVATPVRGSKVIICLLTQRHDGARGLIEDCLGRMTELVILEAESR
jgi:beta-lactamase class A